MASTYRFFPEQNLLYRYAAGGTKEEAQAEQAEDVQFLHNAEKPVNLVIDVRAGTWQPRTAAEMKYAFAPFDSPKLQWLILILKKDENAPLTSFQLSVSFQKQAAGGRFQIVYSLEEAFAFLEARDNAPDLSKIKAEIEQMIESIKSAAKQRENP